MFVFLLALNNH